MTLIYPLEYTPYDTIFTVSLPNAPESQSAERFAGQSSRIHCWAWCAGGLSFPRGYLLCVTPGVRPDSRNSGHGSCLVAETQDAKLCAAAW